MFNRITTVAEAVAISTIIDELEANRPQPKPKPSVRKFKPRNPRRPKHARRGD